MATSFRTVVTPSKMMICPMCRLKGLRLPKIEPYTGSGERKQGEGAQRCSQDPSHPEVSGTLKNTSQPLHKSRRALAQLGDSQMLPRLFFPLPFGCFFLFVCLGF